MKLLLASSLLSLSFVSCKDNVVSETIEAKEISENVSQSIDKMTKNQRKYEEEKKKKNEEARKLRYGQ